MTLTFVALYKFEAAIEGQSIAVGRSFPSLIPSLVYEYAGKCCAFSSALERAKCEIRCSFCKDRPK